MLPLVPQQDGALDEFEQLEQQAARDVAAAALQTPAADRCSRPSSRRSSWADGAGNPSSQLPDGRRHDNAEEQPGEADAGGMANCCGHIDPDTDYDGAPQNAPSSKLEHEHGAAPDCGHGDSAAEPGAQRYGGRAASAVQHSGASRRSAASTLEQLAAPSPARPEPPARPPPRANGYVNGYGHTNGHSHLNGSCQVRAVSFFCVALVRKACTATAR